MEKESIKKTSIQTKPEIQPQQNGFQDILISLLCVSFFPALYVIGKTMLAFLR